MSTPGNPPQTPPFGDRPDGDDATDVFAGLVAIDVVDGELVPREEG